MVATRAAPHRRVPGVAASDQGHQQQGRRAADGRRKRRRPGWATSVNPVCPSDDQLNGRLRSPLFFAAGR